VQDAVNTSRVAQERQRAAEVQIARLRAELEQAASSAKRIQSSHAEELESARNATNDSSQELSCTKAELDERTVQLSVLTDTIEALQVGSESEREQRIVNLTAELVASRMRELTLERRAETLSEKAGRHRKKAAEAEEAADVACGERKVALAAEASMRKQHEQSERFVNELQKQVRHAQSLASYTFTLMCVAHSYIHW
jgi:hypothetical protein